ncbi:Copper resistance protein C precursor [compost metagenome]
MLTRIAKHAANTFVLMAAIAGSSAAFAHAHLKSTAPAQDSTAPAPEVLKLAFSEGIEAKFSSVALTRDGTAVELKGIATAPGDNKVLLVTPAQPLAKGQYQVQWHVISVDTHKSEGAYRFTVGN